MRDDARKSKGDHSLTRCSALSHLVFDAEFSTISDDAGLPRPVALVHRLVLHLLQHAHALHHFSENNVLPVQMRRFPRRDEKLQRCIWKNWGKTGVGRNMKIMAVVLRISAAN